MATRDVKFTLNDVPDDGRSEYVVSVDGDTMSIRRIGATPDAGAYLKPMQKVEDSAYLKPMQKVEDAAYLKPMQKVETIEQKLSQLRVRPTAPDQFRAALTKLSQDSNYRAAAIKDPSHILNDFNLSLKELSALRTAAAMSGADIMVVDKYAAASIAQRAAEGTDVDVSCCSCCCCCCGETAVVPTGW